MEIFGIQFELLHLLGAFAVPALLYIALIHKLPFKGDFVIKSMPILLLAVASWAFVPGFEGKLLAVGFLLSAGGDISLSFQGDKFFILGLGFFLVAHIIYMVTFSQNYAYDMDQIPMMAAIVVFAGGMVFQLYPRLGEMRIPVLIYISVILGMGIFAAMWQGPNPQLLFIGALVFMLSDAMISVDKFIKPISWSKYFIMATYYGGQFMIFAAFLPSMSA